MGAYEFIAADYDRGGALDLEDLAVLQACFSGPAVGYVGNCLKADLDHDADVDQNDFGILQRCFRGDGVPVDANCLN